MGMVLPVAGLFAMGSDLIHRRWPEALDSPWDQPVSLAAMGLLVLVLAPAFVRLAWPTRSLPPGPLRDRLEHLSARVGFRCTDILVWDTNQVVVNAGVTGSLPFFRYVLLTDALVENLSPYEVAAVFGHEVGHIAHRHLVYFGFFILSSLGVLPLSDWTASQAAINEPLRMLPAGVAPHLWRCSEATRRHDHFGASKVVKRGPRAAGPGEPVLPSGLRLSVSRRFERQADVFGCRVVSCGLPDCPPHADLDSPGSPRTHCPSPSVPRVCPVGMPDLRQLPWPTSQSATECGRRRGRGDTAASSAAGRRSSKSLVGRPRPRPGFPDQRPPHARGAWPRPSPRHHRRRPRGGHQWWQ